MDKKWCACFGVSFGFGLLLFTIPFYLIYEESNAELVKLKLEEKDISSEIKNSTMKSETLMTSKQIALKIKELEYRKRANFVGCIISISCGLVCIFGFVSSYVYCVLKDDLERGEDRRRSFIYRIYSPRSQRRRRELVANDVAEIMGRNNELAAEEPVFYRRAPNAEDVAAADQAAPVLRMSSRIQRRRPEVSDDDMAEIRRAINDPAAQEPVFYRRAPNAEVAAAADQPAPVFHNPSRIQRRRSEVSDDDRAPNRRAINNPAAQEPVFYRRAPNAEDVSAADQPAPVFHNPSRIQRRRSEVSDDDRAAIRRAFNDRDAQEPVFYRRAPNAEVAAAAADLPGAPSVSDN